jgi:hypothetical protein
MRQMNNLKINTNEMPEEAGFRSLELGCYECATLPNPQSARRVISSRTTRPRSMDMRKYSRVLATAVSTTCSATTCSVSSSVVDRLVEHGKTMIEFLSWPRESDVSSATDGGTILHPGKLDWV